jgi:small subunit ribosomal protein S16
MGRRHRAAYRVAAMDGRRSRDSKVIELLGTYDPVIPQPEQQLKLDRERIEYWLGVGAQPTDTVRALLKKQGIGAGSS